MPGNLTPFAVTSSTGEDIGIKVDSGGNCVSLEAIAPSTIADTENRPENLICGLIDTEIKVDTPGGVCFDNGVTLVKADTEPLFLERGRGRNAGHPAPAG